MDQPNVAISTEERSRMLVALDEVHLQNQLAALAYLRSFRMSTKTGWATHVVPQAFDTRPSPPLVSPPGQPVPLPDEIMIDWGNTPAGSTASIYWPQVNAVDVIALANQSYSSHLLSAVDANTLQCTVMYRRQGRDLHPDTISERGEFRWAADARPADDDHRWPAVQHRSSPRLDPAAATAATSDRDRSKTDA
jgi:hypothetical protein